MTGSDIVATAELVVRRTPVFLLSIEGSTARINATGARTLTSCTRHQTSRSSSSTAKGLMREMPALLTRISTGPSSLSTCATILSAAPLAVTSATTEIALPFADLISSTRVRRSCSRRATAATDAPAAANTFEIDRPRPTDEPVTMT